MFKGQWVTEKIKNWKDLLSLIKFLLTGSLPHGMKNSNSHNSEHAYDAWYHLSIAGNTWLFFFSLTLFFFKKVGVKREKILIIPFRGKLQYH